MKFTAVTVGALASAAFVSAQSPSLCDKYSTALLNSTEPAQQKTLLTLVVNSALIGNYSNATSATATVKPSGILTKSGTYKDTKDINLLKYFTGELASTNRNGVATSVNFLDGGGAAPLMENKPALDNATDSNQAKLVNHLYSYFGALLGCSSLGQGEFAAYSGNPSQYDVHKFMDLSADEMGYFIQEVAYSALSFGVTMDDVTAVGTALGTTFNNKCGAPLKVAPNQGEAVQSICLGDGCPTAANSTCTASNQGDNKEPAAASTAPSGTSGSSPASPSGSTAPTGAGESLKAPLAALVGAALGAAALL